MEDEKVWYIAKNDDERYGPYTEDEVIKLIEAGVVTPDMYLWMPDLDSWISIENSVYSFYLKGGQTTTSVKEEVIDEEPDDDYEDEDEEADDDEEPEEAPRKRSFSSLFDLDEPEEEDEAGDTEEYTF